MPTGCEASAVGVDDVVDAPECLHQLYVEHAEAIFGFLARRTSRDVADDLLAEVFVRACAALPSYQDRGTPVRGWLITIAANLLRDRARRGHERVIPVAEVRNLELLPSAENDALARAELVALSEALMCLPEPSQLVLDLRFLRELSVDETAAVLGIGADAVRARTYRALKALRTVCTERGLTRG